MKSSFIYVNLVYFDIFVSFLQQHFYFPTFDTWHTYLKPRTTFWGKKRNEFVDKNYSDNVHDKSGREQDRYQNGVSMKMKENKHCTKETIRARVSERE